MSVSKKRMAHQKPPGTLEGVSGQLHCGRESVLSPSAGTLSGLERVALSFLHRVLCTGSG